MQATFFHIYDASLYQQNLPCETEKLQNHLSEINLPYTSVHVILYTKVLIVE